MNWRSVTHLAETWLTLDFFTDSRAVSAAAPKGDNTRTPESGSTLTTTIFTQAFLGLVIAALLFPDTPPVAYASANLSLSTILIAAGAQPTAAWLLRARTDAVLLRTAPLHRWQMGMALLLHRGAFLTLTTVGVALPPAILMSWLTGHRLGTVPSYLLAAVLSAGTLTLAIDLFTKLALRWLGPERGQLVGGTLRAGLLGAGLVAFATCLSRLKGTAAQLPVPTELLTVWPPYLLAQWLVRADWAQLAWVLLGFAALLLASSAIAIPTRYLAGHRRSGLLLRLTAQMAGSARQRGLATFVATMLYRSPHLRMRLLPLLGIPVAFVWLSMRQVDARDRLDYLAFFLQLPSVYLPFLVAFLPHADQPRVAWIFATAPELTQRDLHRATHIALVSHILVPVYAITTPMLLLLAPQAAAAALLALSSFALAILVSALASRNLTVVPFSADRDPNDDGLRFDQVLVYGLVLTIMAIALSRGIQSWFGPGIALALAVLAALSMLRSRDA